MKKIARQIHLEKLKQVIEDAGLKQDRYAVVFVDSDWGYLLRNGDLPPKSDEDAYAEGFWCFTVLRGGRIMDESRVCWTDWVSLDKMGLPATEVQTCESALHTLIDHGLENDGISMIEQLIAKLKEEACTTSQK